MTIALDPELEARVRAAAEARGADPNRYAVALLTQALERDTDKADVLSPEEAERMHAGIRSGLADEQAGRVRSAEVFFAELESRHPFLRP